MTINRSDKIFDTINIFLLIIVVLIVIYPLLFVISASVSDPDILNRGEIWLFPKGVNLDGYFEVVKNESVWIGYRNTIFYAVFGVCINLFVTFTCAFSLSRKELLGRNFFALMFAFTMFFSGGIIPNFLLVKYLGIYDTIWAVLLPNAAAMWNIIITRTYIQTSIPEDVYEAARIDGCSDFRIFSKIALPLSIPIVAVMALYYGVSHWNSFFLPLMYLNNRKLLPLQLILREILLSNQAMMVGSDVDQTEAIAKIAKLTETIKYSLIIVSTVPILCVYPFIQKYFIKGIMLGAVKG